MKIGESDIINNAAVCKLGILQFVRIIRLNWIGHVNRMDSKRKGSQVFNNNPQRSRLRGRPKNRWWNCVQRLIVAKLKTGKRGQKTELPGRSPLRRRRYELDCGDIAEEEGGGGEGEEKQEEEEEEEEEVEEEEGGGEEELKFDTYFNRNFYGNYCGRPVHHNIKMSKCSVAEHGLLSGNITC